MRSQLTRRHFLGQRCEVLQCPAATKFINRPMREPWHSAVYEVA